MMVGKAKYNGAEPNVKIKNVLRRPIASDTAAQPNLPPDQYEKNNRRLKLYPFVCEWVGIRE